MSYNSLSGTIVGPDKITAKLDGTFTQITGTISGSYIDASGTAVSFADIPVVDLVEQLGLQKTVHMQMDYLQTLIPPQQSEQQ